MGPFLKGLNLVLSSPKGSLPKILLEILCSHPAPAKDKTPALASLFHLLLVFPLLGFFTPRNHGQTLIWMFVPTSKSLHIISPRCWQVGTSRAGEVWGWGTTTAPVSSQNNVPVHQSHLLGRQPASPVMLWDSRAQPLLGKLATG